MKLNVVIGVPPILSSVEWNIIHWPFLASQVLGVWSHFSLWNNGEDIGINLFHECSERMGDSPDIMKMTCLSIHMIDWSRLTFMRSSLLAIWLLSSEKIWARSVYMTNTSLFTWDQSCKHRTKHHGHYHHIYRINICLGEEFSCCWTRMVVR